MFEFMSSKVASIGIYFDNKVCEIICTLIHDYMKIDLFNFDGVEGEVEFAKLTSLFFIKYRSAAIMKA